MDKAQQQVRPAAQSSKTLVQELAHLLAIHGRDVRQVAFEIAMAVFLGIKFRGIPGQWLNDDFGMFEEVAQGGLTRVDGGPVADQDKAFRHEAAQMLQRDDHIVTIHAVIEMPLVDFARQAQTDGGRQNAPVLGHPMQQRALAARRPRAPQPFQEREAKLVKKHYVYAVPPRLFLSGASPAPTRRGSGLPRVPRPVAAVAASSSLGGPTTG